MDVCQKLSVENTTLRFTEHKRVIFFGNFFLSKSVYNNIIYHVKKNKRFLCVNLAKNQFFEGKNNCIYEEKIIF